MIVPEVALLRGPLLLFCVLFVDIIVMVFGFVLIRGEDGGKFPRLLTSASVSLLTHMSACSSFRCACEGRRILFALEIIGFVGRYPLCSPPLHLAVVV